MFLHMAPGPTGVAQLYLQPPGSWLASLLFLDCAIVSVLLQGLCTS